MQLRINAEVAEDLAKIKNYIEQDSEQNAKEVVMRIVDCIENLLQFPDSGMKLENHTKRRNNYRFKIILPYLVFYKIEKDVIKVYRVLHAAQNYIKLLEL